MRKHELATKLFLLFGPGVLVGQVIGCLCCGNPWLLVAMAFLCLLFGIRSLVRTRKLSSQQPGMGPTASRNRSREDFREYIGWMLLGSGLFLTLLFLLILAHRHGLL